MQAKTSEASQATQKKAGEVKEQGKGMAHYAQEKGMEASQAAQEKATQAKEQTGSLTQQVMINVGINFFWVYETFCDQYILPFFCVIGWRQAREAMEAVKSTVTGGGNNPWDCSQAAVLGFFVSFCE